MTPEREKRARRLAESRCWQRDTAFHKVESDGSPCACPYCDAIFNAICQWDAETAEPLRAEVARLARLTRMPFYADDGVSAEVRLAEAQEEIARLTAELAEVESYRRGLGQSKLFDALPLPTSVTDELTALRAVQDAAVGVLAHYGNNIVNIGKIAVAMDALGSALAACPAPSGKEG